MEELKKLISTSYGSEDHKFAGHSFDIERAALSIVEANTNNVGFEQFLELHREFLSGRGCSENHIEEQIIKIKDITKYFQND